MISAMKVEATSVPVMAPDTAAPTPDAENAAVFSLEPEATRSPPPRQPVPAMQAGNAAGLASARNRHWPLWGEDATHDGPADIPAAAALSHAGKTDAAGAGDAQPPGTETADQTLAPQAVADPAGPALAAVLPPVVPVPIAAPENFDLPAGNPHARGAVAESGPALADRKPALAAGTPRGTAGALGAMRPDGPRAMRPEDPLAMRPEDPLAMRPDGPAQGPARDNVRGPRQDATGRAGPGTALAAAADAPRFAQSRVAGRASVPADQVPQLQVPRGQTQMPHPGIPPRDAVAGGAPASASARRQVLSDTEIAGGTSAPTSPPAAARPILNALPGAPGLSDATATGIALADKADGKHPTAVRVVAGFTGSGLADAIPDLPVTATGVPADARTGPFAGAMPDPAAPDLAAPEPATGRTNDAPEGPVARPLSSATASPVQTHGRPPLQAPTGTSGAAEASPGGIAPDRARQAPDPQAPDLHGPDPLGRASAQTAPAPVGPGSPHDSPGSSHTAGPVTDRADGVTADAGAALSAGPGNDTAPARDPVGAATPNHAASLPRHNLAHMAHLAAQFPDRPVELTLSPEELGSVRMTFGASDGTLSLSITAERPETLDLLRRHIDLLARDFRDLGLGDVNFRFSSGSEGNARQQAPFGTSPQPPAPPAPDLATENPVPPRAMPGQTHAGNPDGGLDLRL